MIPQSTARNPYGQFDPQFSHNLKDMSLKFNLPLFIPPDYKYQHKNMRGQRLFQAQILFCVFAYYVYYELFLGIVQLIQKHGIGLQSTAYVIKNITFIIVVWLGIFGALTKSIRIQTWYIKGWTWMKFALFSDLFFSYIAVFFDIAMAIHPYLKILYFFGELIFAILMPIHGEHVRTYYSIFQDKNGEQAELQSESELDAPSEQQAGSQQAAAVSVKDWQVWKNLKMHLGIQFFINCFLLCWFSYTWLHFVKSGEHEEYDSKEIFIYAEQFVVFVILSLVGISSALIGSVSMQTINMVFSALHVINLVITDVIMLNDAMAEVGAHGETDEEIEGEVDLLAFYIQFIIVKVGIVGFLCIQSAFLRSKLRENLDKAQQLQEQE